MLEPPFRRKIWTTSIVAPMGPLGTAQGAPSCDVAHSYPIRPTEPFAQSQRPVPRTADGGPETVVHDDLELSGGETQPSILRLLGRVVRLEATADIGLFLASDSARPICGALDGVNNGKAVA